MPEIERSWGFARLNFRPMRRSGDHWVCGLAVALSVSASGVRANDPLSAIDWLENRPAQIVTPLETLDLPRANEPPVAGGVRTPEVTVTPLGAPSREAAGLLPSSVTGLPRSLWSGSDGAVLDGLIEGLGNERSAAVQSLLYTLLLAEADAPALSERSDFMRTRVKALLEFGALDPAAALLERADPAHVDLFDLYFDVALLNGTPGKPCAALQAQSRLSRDMGARIFCAARGQDWDGAMLTLVTADAIGALDALEVALLEHFLDPELFENEPIPEAPARPTPLQFRLYEAIGEALPTASLTRAFSATDLSGDVGWKAQAEAAERLARVGAISDNRLLGIYTSRIPSASGGVWDRIEAVQRLETALRSGDPAAIFKQVARAWPQMRDAGLDILFAGLFAERLLQLPPLDVEGGAPPDMITKIALVSPYYEQAAARATEDPLVLALQSVARGASPEMGASPLQDAIARGFSSVAPPHRLTALVGEEKLGEAILRAILHADLGAAGDTTALTGAIAFMRSVGLEEVSRRFALQLLLGEAG
jgi:hypothetical protein